MQHHIGMPVADKMRKCSCSSRDRRRKCILPVLLCA